MLEQVSNEDNQLVIAHDSRYADDAEAVAKETRVPELVWGERPDRPTGLVGEITVEDKEGGYMAGIVAAQGGDHEKTRGHRDRATAPPGTPATWNRMAGGFVAGARSIDPESAESDYAQVGEDGHATRRAGARRRRCACSTAASQMIFALGGGRDGRRAARGRGGKGENQFVGVIGDKAAFNRDNYVLGVDHARTRDRSSSRRVRDLRAGTFGDRPYALTLRNRGVRLFTTGRTPRDASKPAVAAGREIEAGRSTCPVTPTQRSRRGS